MSGSGPPNFRRYISEKFSAPTVMKQGSLDSSGELDYYGFYIFALPFLVFEICNFCGHFLGVILSRFQLGERVKQLCMLIDAPNLLFEGLNCICIISKNI